jgi:hypothetical protein
MVFVTVFGSCRQQPINKVFRETCIREKLSFPHYSKEILEVIKYCKYNHIHKNETKYIFRSPILQKSEINDYNIFKNEFYNSHVFLIEIASLLQYKYKDFFVHHIATEDQYNVEIRKEIQISQQVKEELEDDILEIKKQLNKPFIIVTHLVTKNTGNRFLLSSWLEEFGNKYNFPVINPVKEFIKRNISLDNLFQKEEILAHYTLQGEEEISKIYKEYIEKEIAKPNVYQVWSQKCYNVPNPNSFWGLGDILRGTIKLYQMSQKNNFNFFVTTDNHPLKNCLKPCFEAEKNIKFVYPEEVETNLLCERSNYILTNAFCDENLTESCKKFMKKILEPNEIILQSFKNLNIEQYKVLHFRLGDNYLLHNNQANFETYLNIFEKYYDEETIFICDCENFKNFIVKKNENKKINILNTKVCHFGVEQNVEKIQNSFLEFFLLTKSKIIYTYTNYSWTSGFTFWASRIYDVPLVKI